MTRRCDFGFSRSIFFRYRGPADTAHEACGAGRVVAQGPVSGPAAFPSFFPATQNRETKTLKSRNVEERTLRYGARGFALPLNQHGIEAMILAPGCRPLKPRLIC